MKNLKKDLEETLYWEPTTSMLIAAQITWSSANTGETGAARLPLNYSADEEAQFWESLDTEIHGNQIKGTLWTSEGGWYEKIAPHNGDFPQWKYFKYPDIPEELASKKE